ncbi:hypothetical protein D3C80_494490 [compost metagenome]
MQRARATEIEPWLNVQIRKSQLQGNDNADQEADDTPENSGDRAVFDDFVEIFRLCRDGSWCTCGCERDAAQHDDAADAECQEQHPHMGGKQTVMRVSRAKQRQECPDYQRCSFQRVVHCWYPPTA